MGSLESAEKARGKGCFRFPFCWSIDGSGFPKAAVEKLGLAEGKEGRCPHPAVLATPQGLGGRLECNLYSQKTNVMFCH